MNENLVQENFNRYRASRLFVLVLVPDASLHRVSKDETVSLCFISHVQSPDSSVE